ncbi:MAG: hypothetical protein SO170_05130 [Butyribacter sp.]|nr:hypothetical protein [bacterium]MDY3854332.1 hypothetical protein [Butyribacter sp.]
MSQKYEIDGYSFESRSEYERAQKEKETILYLTSNTNMGDMKAVYKIYKQAAEKKSFRTVFGLTYMENLRKRLLGSEFITEDLLEPIPVVQTESKPSDRGMTANTATGKRKQAEEVLKRKANNKVKNFLIAVLIVIIGVMVFITYKSQYSVFTYFTNYKENMREELINEYEEWTNELEERESKVEEREKKLEQEEKQR